MTNTTDTFWSADGVSLQTYAQNIETLGARLAPPPFRGQNITIPYAPGQRWTPKVVDSRIIPLAMWVRGCNPNGGAPANANEKFHENWRSLRNLLWNPNRQILLKKQFRINGVIRSATAKAEFKGGLEPSMIGPNGAKFVVDLELADPYFYDDELRTFNLVTGAQTLNLLGDAETRNILLTINGARDNVKVIVTDPMDLQVEYPGSLLTGDSVQLDVMNYKATTTLAGAPAFDSTGKIRHTGAPHWLALASGDTQVTLASTFGLGTVQLQARGAWI